MPSATITKARSSPDAGGSEPPYRKSSSEGSHELYVPTTTDTTKQSPSVHRTSNGMVSTKGMESSNKGMNSSSKGTNSSSKGMYASKGMTPSKGMNAYDQIRLSLRMRSSLKKRVSTDLLSNTQAVSEATISDCTLETPREHTNLALYASVSREFRELKYALEESKRRLTALKIAGLEEALKIEAVRAIEYATKFTAHCVGELDSCEAPSQVVYVCGLVLGQLVQMDAQVCLSKDYAVLVKAMCEHLLQRIATEVRRIMRVSTMYEIATVHHSSLLNLARLQEHVQARMHDRESESVLAWDDGMDRLRKLCNGGGAARDQLAQPTVNVLLNTEKRISWFKRWQGVQYSDHEVCRAVNMHELMNQIGVPMKERTRLMHCKELPAVLMDLACGPGRNKLTHALNTLCRAGDGVEPRATPSLCTPIRSIVGASELRLQYTLEGHVGAISCVAISDDTLQVASASNDNTVKLWSTSRGRCQFTLCGHKASVTSVAFGDGIDKLASGSKDGTVRIWDPNTGARLSTLRTESRLKFGKHRVESGVACIATMEGARSVVGGCDDHTIRVWDTRTGKRTRCLTAHGGGVTTVACAPDGRRLASGSMDKTVTIWDPVSWCQTGLLQHNNRINAVAFSGDRTIMATAEDQLVKMWDLRKLEEMYALPIEAYSLAFRSDGTTLAIGSRDCEICTYNPYMGKRLGNTRGHSGNVSSVTFSKQGNYFASASSDMSVKLWNVVEAGTDSRRPVFQGDELDAWI